MTVQTTGRAPWWRVLPTKRAMGLILAAVALVLPNLIDIDGLSEAGERMPQKSTYFYPKILTGLVINPLD